MQPSDFQDSNIQYSLLCQLTSLEISALSPYLR